MRRKGIPPGGMIVDDAPDAGDDAPVVVPPERLPADVLHRLVEEFVTRDGTDYGAVERTLEQRMRDVTRQLERGEVVIVYDPASETANILPRRSLRA